MVKLKRAFSFALASLLIVSTVSGCGKKAANTTEQQKASNEPVKLTLLGPGKSNKFIKFDDRDKYPVWQETKKLFDNAKLDLQIEIVANEQYPVTIKTRMASGDKLPDIVNISALDNTTVLNLAKQGVILDLNTLIDKYSNGNIKDYYNKKFPYAKKLTTSPDGKMYWFSDLHQKTYQNTKEAPVGKTMGIRKEWLEKLNLKMPTTAQEYFDVLKAFRDKDANGSGQADEILNYDPSDFKSPIAQWFGLGTDITAVDVENKKVVSPWYQPGVKDYFKYLQQLTKAGILDTSLIGAGNEQKLQKLSENKVSSLVQYNLASYTSSQIKGGGDYMPCMPLKAVDSITPAAQIEPAYLVWQKYAITKDCKDPKAAIAFFDTVYSDKYADLLYWGIEGTTYKKDSNGIKTYINNGSDEEKAKTGQVTLNQLAGDTVFPRIQFANLEYELASDPQYKIDNQMKIMSYKPYFVNMNNNYLAIPEGKDLEEKTKILKDLTTYCQELSVKLALGQNSLDNWDKYMADLKKLGLDRLIEIDQKLLDRYNSIK